ncbi:hypothetical protein ULF88_07355 [Halopseudomonas pachastrellae]|nr:hypothetical protein [Halopseudomonas pachastrellae]
MIWSKCQARVGAAGCHTPDKARGLQTLQRKDDNHSLFDGLVRPVFAGEQRMKAVWLVALLAAPLSVQAQQALQQAQEESRELTAEAVATQQRIDNLDDAARAALENIPRLRIRRWR